MCILNEEIMVDGKAIERYRPPSPDDLIDLEKVLSVAPRSNAEEEERARKLRAESLLIEMREESRVYYNG